MACQTQEPQEQDSNNETNPGGTSDIEVVDLEGSGSDADGDGKGCAEAQTSAQLIPTNLLFVVDTSGSMNCNAPPLDSECLRPLKIDPNEPSKWESTRAALAGVDDGLFATLLDFQGLSVGLITFPVDNRCAILPAGELTTDISLLNSSQMADLGAALDLLPEGETPLSGAAIRGLDILRADLVAADSTENSFLVLMTDGVETCQPAALEDLKTYVTQALEIFNIHTFVIGAPGSAASRSLLSEIAFRGGTASASDCSHGGDVDELGDCHIDLTESSDFSADLASVFSQIAVSTQAICEFDVPSDAFVDPSKVNVVFTSGQDHEETIFFDERDCQTAADGWQYASPTQEKIVLCGRTCDTLRADPQGQVEVVFGCAETIVR